jgi:Zn-finger nucleic acid-binding protein
MTLAERPVLACQSCGGIFLDNVSSQVLTEGLSAEFVAFDTRVQRSTFTERSQNPAHEAMFQCPRCLLQMLRTHVAAANVYVDACAEHGTWFDREELTLVGNAFGALHYQREAAKATQAPKPQRVKTAADLEREDREVREFQAALRTPQEGDDFGGGSITGADVAGGVLKIAVRILVRSLFR